MALEIWEDFFKPEVRRAGQVFVSKGKVALMHPSDTELQAYIRSSPPFKVQFKSPSVASTLVTATCTCPQSKKGQLCKHIWATLVVAEEKNPDFFSIKTDLCAAAKNTTEKNTITDPPTVSPERPQQAAYKLKQAEYRKQQYKLQKERQKERSQKFKKTKNPKIPAAVSHPDDVMEALRYFSQNGFILEESLNAEAIGSARKKLARVFHPDRGGTHDEITELNQFTEVLLRYSVD